MTETSYDYGELLVVQHATRTGPGAVTGVLDTRADQRPWRLIDLGAGAALPALDRAAGILVLGGPMGVHDVADNPWIDDELELLRGAAASEVTVFGICLGAQLMGAALGGRVETRDRPEIGYLPLQRTEAGRTDAVFAGWPDGAAVFFLHDDEVVDLPEGAEPMLTGSEGVAAWRSPDSTSYGVQFHPEVDAGQVAAWLSHDANRRRCEEAGVDPDELAAEAARRDDFHRAVGLSLVGRWIDQVVGADDPDPRRGRRARA